jgi:HemY protein
MFRLIAYFTIIALVSGVITWLGNNSGDLELNWLGYRITMNVATGLVALTLLTIIIFLLFQLLWWLIRLPTNMTSRNNQRKLEKGWVAITRGMTALIEHDNKRAQKYSRKLLSSMENEPLAHMMAAFTAQQAGNINEARKHYESLLEFKDTEMVGIRGLLVSAGEQGKLERAIELAERAFKKDQEARGITPLLLSLYKKAGKWNEALNLIETKTSLLSNLIGKNDSGDHTDWKKAKGFVLHMQARSAERNGEIESAFTLYRSALEATPYSVPLLLDYAGLAGTLSNNQKLLSAIEKCWKHSTHPELAEKYVNLHEDKTIKSKIKAAKKLAAKNPEDIESCIILASIYGSDGDYFNAREALKPALIQKETIRLTSMMAEFWKKDKSSDPEKAEEWERRARNAIADDTWVCIECHSIHEAWASTCEDCESVDSIEWGSPKPKRSNSPKLPLLG